MGSPKFTDSPVREPADRWTTAEAAELYDVASWGKGYFSVGKNGNLQVHPEKDASRAITSGRLKRCRKACASIGGEIVKVTPTSELGLGAVLPGRSLVVIRKLRETPSRYPRSPAEAKRRPW